MATPHQKRAADVQDHLFNSIELVSWLATILSAFVVVCFPLPYEQKRQAALLLIVAALFIWLFFHWIVPRYGTQSGTHLIAAIGSILVLTWASYLFAPYGLYVNPFYILVIATVGMTSSSPTVLAVALLTILSDGFITILLLGTSPTVLLQLALRGIVYLSCAYIVNSLAGARHKHTEQISLQNRELAFLLDASTTMTSSLDMETILSGLVVKIAVGLPVTLCRLCLLDRDRHVLVTHGVHALHPLGDWQPVTDESWSLQDMPQLRAAVDNATVTLLMAKDAPTALQQQEQNVLFPSGIKVICFVPIIADGTMLGAILAGEARDVQREPFDQNKLSLLQTLAAQMGTIIQNAHLHQATQRQAERFAALVEIGRAISSTLDLDDLLELIHQQVSLAIPGDTYYVALYDQRAGVFDTRILVDEGKRFPRQRVPLGQGLATWVVLKRQPLMIRYLTDELDALPSAPIILGQERQSESWLGAPMMTGDSILGLLAVGSYRPYAFDEDDKALLNAVAQQASLALDNAHHHAQVQDQARRDSLTGVHNHGHLLYRLGEEVKKCADSKRPVSLIMVDIDHFKSYNDQYGHTIGDQVLRFTAQTMQAHIKDTGVVGRWGGEEFAVLLPGTTAEEAEGVAERIRTSLATASLVDTHGEAIPKPTISQGIASFPLHVSTAEDLIILADRMLYSAKRGGRNRIKVAGSSRRHTAGHKLP